MLFGFEFVVKLSEETKLATATSAPFLPLN